MVMVKISTTKFLYGSGSHHKVLPNIFSKCVHSSSSSNLAPEQIKCCCVKRLYQIKSFCVIASSISPNNVVQSDQCDVYLVVSDDEPTSDLLTGTNWLWLPICKETNCAGQAGFSYMIS